MTQERPEEDGWVNTQTEGQPQAQAELVTTDGEVIEDDDHDSTMIPIAESALANLASKQDIDDAVERALLRVEATKRFKLAMLSMTNAFDWYGMRAEGEPDGHPYLAESGATKVMHAFGVQLHHDGGKRINCKEGGYEYVYDGRVRALAFSDAWFPVVGSRWSDDGFFTKGGKNRADEGDVRKAALTNFYNRAIKLVTGIKSITWDELEQVPHHAGLRNRVRKIGFSGGSGGASAPAGTIAGLQKGPHVMVDCPYENLNARNMIKNMPKGERTFTGKEGNPQNVWIVKWSKKNFNMMADLGAEDGKFRFKPVNVPADELP